MPARARLVVWVSRSAARAVVIIICNFGCLLPPPPFPCDNELWRLLQIGTFFGAKYKHDLCTYCVTYLQLKYALIYIPLTRYLGR